LADLIEGNDTAVISNDMAISDLNNTLLNSIAEFENSDDNDVDQSNDQEIDEVKKDSHAENDPENSVSFE
jgi:hypothetical protein